MMKEWKNNPESDEENTAVEMNYGTIQENVKGHQPSRPSRNILNVNSTSDEEEEKQVGRANKISRKNKCFISPNFQIPSQHLEHCLPLLSLLLLVCNKGVA